MACYHPIGAYRDRDGGEVRIGKRPGEQGDKLELPCGRCIGCRFDRARDWSVRIMHEAQLYDSNRFVTLTYSDEKLPASRSLDYRDFQLFMKRLRRSVRGDRVAPNGKKPIRFFCAGEYGENTGRPHYHAILFNVRLRDEVRWHNGAFRSEVLDRVWSLGQVHVGEVTAGSAAYVARYTQGKVYGFNGEDPRYYEDAVDLRTGEVFERLREFCQPSLRPGIGAWWYEKYSSDLFPHDFAIDREGRKNKVPRYYRDKFAKSAPGEEVEALSHARFLRAMEVDRNENTEGRRAVREAVAWHRVNTFNGRGKV